MSELYDKLQKRPRVRQGSTDKERIARISREQSSGYRGSKHRSWQLVRDVWLEIQVNDAGFWVCDISHGFGCGRWLQRHELEVDHIIKRSLRPDLVLEPTNFEVLCNPCHVKKDGGMRVAP